MEERFSITKAKVLLFTLFVSSYMLDQPLMFAVSEALPNQLVWAGTSQTLVCTNTLLRSSR